MNRRVFFLLLAILCGSGASAQVSKIDSLTLDTLHDAEIRLWGLADKMVHDYDEETRLMSGLNFIRTLSHTLRIRSSYYYPFDSLKSVSILYAPDKLFRIMTWNVATNDENFRYFGVIQMNPDITRRYRDTAGLRMFYPLIDRSDSINEPLFAITDKDHWFGANYYQMVRVTSQKATYYILLGWDGATARSNKKVVEALSFQNNRPVFGAPIFDMKGKRVFNRMLWEFSNSAKMTLRYEEKRKILVFENLVPPNLNQTGIFETYIPDGSYDLMMWKNGRWEKQEGMLDDFKME